MQERVELDINSFVLYIADKHNKDYHSMISLIKLQKSLYFCFAYWGGFILNSKKSESMLNFSPYLFHANFQAWGLGPVISEIVKKYNAKEYDNISLTQDDIERIFNNNKILKETIISLLNDIFQISDFKLVNIAYDNTWKSHYEGVKNKIMPADEIIKEYSIKVCE